MLDVVGWVATGIFSASYFFRRPAALRRIQAMAAGLWIVYGFAIKAYPVVIANIIVAAAALFSTSRRERGGSFFLRTSDDPIRCATPVALENE